ncbi:LysE family transporter [Actinospica sp. MGRD01-02]|uniref:LysE family transporter n=1 Tax=Actinospica acidithermotolerans TaxID=2828514 RepID=A0A941IK24_9ACTN|nr:LysE family transporter [Actinospica acidithermotolerans]MBR7827683.1 LysE family transporter [Actinospica acidithermotolerans]
MTPALLAGLLAGYGIAIPVGAIGTYLVALTARTSLRIGACAALGVATADGVYALIAQIGGSALARTLAPVVGPLRWISAAVVAALAVRIAVSAFAQRKRSSTAADGNPDGILDEGTNVKTPYSPVRAYLGLWAVTMMNPLTLIYFAALVLGMQGRSAPDRLDQAVFVLAAFLASASWQLLLALGGALLGRLLTGERGRFATGLGSSAVIAFLAVRLLIT